MSRHPTQSGGPTSPHLAQEKWRLWRSNQDGQLHFSHYEDPTMRTYTLEYLFNGERRTYLFEFKQLQLPVHDAAMHLLQLHFGDGENSLIMPTADATPEEILEQAALVGLTQIKVVVQPG
jgi:hypothetical protein